MNIQSTLINPKYHIITDVLASIWRPFIPFASYQVFQRGGYFSVEVVSGEIAVISLNTMYFYDSNKGRSHDMHSIESVDSKIIDIMRHTSSRRRM